MNDEIIEKKKLKIKESIDKFFNDRIKQYNRNGGIFYDNRETRFIIQPHGYNINFVNNENTHYIADINRYLVKHIKRVLLDLGCTMITIDNFYNEKSTSKSKTISFNINQIKLQN